MPNHWHFVVWPESADQKREFLYRLSLTHTLRWQPHHQPSGSGHPYQGRFTSFPVQEDEHVWFVPR